MSEDRFAIPGLEGRLVVMFVSTVSAAKADDGDGILLMRVRGRELERERTLVGLGMAGPKNKVAELASLLVRTGASASISCSYEGCDFRLV